MIAAFIETLGQTAVPPHCTNPYSEGNRHNDSRRHNLQLYLTQMTAWQPKIMLVGEAPGYRGCRLSGIPFVSRTILQNGMENVALFGTQHGYHLPDEWPHIQKEASATIVWQAIAAMQPPSLPGSFPITKYGIPLTVAKRSSPMACSQLPQKCARPPLFDYTSRHHATNYSRFYAIADSLTGSM